ncbi:hypothetical protein BCUN_0848 [Bifidobacterium cuniculi]|uniref:Uncharacterized protein n=2 Tax=Bifidobacterium cuniculi TaxID=1688 RepID=A0A087AW65_9BIFI|nr:hypothetical protein BCUN_0848 [Bifidobacterium cuniculi]
MPTSTPTPTPTPIPMQQPVQQPPYRTHQYGKPWVTATRVIAILLMVGGVQAGVSIYDGLEPGWGTMFAGPVSWAVGLLIVIMGVFLLVLAQILANVTIIAENSDLLVNQGMYQSMPHAATPVAAPYTPVPPAANTAPQSYGPLTVTHW